MELNSGARAVLWLGLMICIDCVVTAVGRKLLGPLPGLNVKKLILQPDII